MSITRSTIAAVSITAGIAGALIMSALPAQAHPGHEGNGGNRQGGGGFAVQCDFSHSASVDPIVMPGHTGMSHLHEFFGNTTTNENSTGASLLAGSTTCSDSNNLSAYWVPALYQDGTRVAPVSARVNYEGRGANVTAFPAGFMALTGRTDQSAAWGCATRGAQPTFGTSVATVPTCDPGSRLVAQITFPQCWDGTNLDSADHISHLASATANVCPTSHPVRVPQVTLSVSYSAAATGGSGVTLASGAASTLHADIFEAWAGNSLQNRLSGRGGQRPAVAGGPQNGQQNLQQNGQQNGQRGGQAVPNDGVPTDQAGVPVQGQAQAPAQNTTPGQGNRGNGGGRGQGQRGGGAAPTAPAA
jgi:hypothetical protein